MLLYRWLLSRPAADRPPLMTFDIDWALPPRLGHLEGESLHQRMAQGGVQFSVARRRQRADHLLSAQTTWCGQARPDLCRIHSPREGSKTDRHGTNREIIEVEPELHAQTDPYLGLLLVENLELDASSVEGTRLSTPHLIRLPHPICFVVQKILIRHRREPHKRANDAAHIYEVALLTHGRWEEMAEVLAQIEKELRFPPNWFTRARRTLSDVFLRSDAPGPREIASIYQGIMGRTSAPTDVAISRVLGQFSEATGLFRR